MIKPYFINVHQEILDDLNVRIKNTRWPDEMDSSGWNYGANLSYIKELSDYWLNDFNWRKIESEINSLPNFMAEIDGHQIHFLHIKGKGKKSIPLIITHGWPGSFIEMLKLIPLLTNDENFSFDLVIPSVIGFGFSSKCVEPGCDNAYVANVWHKLMLKLGYEKYGAQGGDIGSGISTQLGMKYPDVYSSIYVLSACCMEGQVTTSQELMKSIEAVTSIDQLEGASFRVMANLTSAASWAPNPNNPPSISTCHLLMVMFVRMLLPK